MLVSEMDTYTILHHSLFPQSSSAIEEMTVWCEITIGPMDADWAITLQTPASPDERWRSVWVFRRANDALAFSLHFRGRK